VLVIVSLLLCNIIIKCLVLTDDVPLQWLRNLLDYKIPHAIKLPFPRQGTKTETNVTLPFGHFTSVTGYRL